MLGAAVTVEMKLGPLFPTPRFSLLHGFSQRLIDAYKRLRPEQRCVSCYDTAGDIGIVESV